MQQPAEDQREHSATTRSHGASRRGEEQRLFRRWRGGDNKAGSRLLERLRTQMVRHFRRRAPGQAEDLAHETLVTFVCACDRLRDDAALMRFVYRIADRTFCRVVLRRRQPMEVFDEQFVTAGGTAVGAGLCAPASVVPQVEAARLLGRAASYTDTLVEYYIDGRSAPEIADARQVDVRKVRNQLRNGLAAMRRCAEDSTIGR